VVSDLVAEDVLTDYKKIYADTTVDDAKKILDNSSPVGVLVFDKNEKLVGIISKKYFQAHYKNAFTISNIMYTKFPTAIPQDYVFSVIQKMNSYPFDLVPIISPHHEGEVIGVVTNESIFKSLTKSDSDKPKPKT
jgi:predicted transcriptional regulator